MEKAEIERLMDEIVAHEAFEFNRRLKPLGISVEIRMVGHTARGETRGDRVTASYMESMNEYSKQEIMRYVRGVYDGSQAVKRQFGLDREPSAQAGKRATGETRGDRGTA